MLVDGNHWLLSVTFQLKLQKGCGSTFLDLHNFFGRSGCDDVAAVRSGFRTNFDKVVGFGHDLETVLNDNDGVPVVDEMVYDLEKALHVGGVKADTRLFDEVKVRPGLAVLAESPVGRATDAAG